MRPINYIQAKDYLQEHGLWFSNMQYFEGWAILTAAQEHYDKRKSNGK